MDREAYEEMALGAVEVAAFALIANKLDKYVKQSARNTIALNASNDPRCRGYRRVASPTACEFCRQQADEGVVTKGDGGSFHAGCGCQNEPVFGNENSLQIDADERNTDDLKRIREEYPNDYEQWREAVRKVDVESGSAGNNVERVSTWSLKPDSRFLAVDDANEFNALVEECFGCEVSNGFKKLPVDVKRWLMADLDALCDDFPIAARGLSLIGVAEDMGNTAIMVEPMTPTGKYQMIFNKEFFSSIRRVEERYSVSLANKNQVANSSWPSLAYHDGFHGVEIALCANRYRGSGPEFYPAWSSCEIATEIVDEAYDGYAKDVGAVDRESFLIGISHQAGKTDSEAIAEAARDVKVNGNDACPESISIVGVTRRRFNV